MKSKLRAGAAWSIPGGYQDGGASMLQIIWKFQWGKMMETTNTVMISPQAAWHSVLNLGWREPRVFLAAGVHHSDTPTVPICSPPVYGKTLLLIQRSFVF